MVKNRKVESSRKVSVCVCRLIVTVISTIVLGTRAECEAEQVRRATEVHTDHSGKSLSGGRVDDQRYFR